MRRFHGMNARFGRATCRRADVPEHLRSWLFDPRSLTRRLARHCPGGPQVRLLDQGWRVPPANERALLGLDLRQRALVREVVLACGDSPWVFARSVFPRASLRDARWRIGHLGTRPLGEVLFTTPGMRRVEVRVSPAAPASDLSRRCIEALGTACPPIWRRDSLFACRGRALLVSELFLEALTDIARG